MIPVLNLKDGDDVEDCKALVSYLSTIGFVYLKNHGIAEDKIQACRTEAKTFFARDEDYKRSFYSELTDKYVGYKPHESERLNQDRKEFDMREAILFDAIDVASNEWPSDSFKDATTPLMKELGALAARLLVMIGVGMELKNPKIFAEAHTAFDETNSQDVAAFSAFRINQYPAIEEGQLKGDQVLCGEHADFGTITLLIQDHVPGLEVNFCRKISSGKAFMD